MADIVSRSVRSRMMSGIRGKNTKPERLIRQLLFAEGFRFRLHRRDLPGAPDIVMPKYRAVIFVHGCFWHGHEGCPYFRIPSSNAEFWGKKLAGNVARDKLAVAALRRDGWRVLIVWECATRARTLNPRLGEKLKAWLLGPKQRGEIRLPAAR